MEYKKRWILFGILFILLVNVISITALGSGASFGGNINIPMGNQTFPNITTNPSDNADDEITFDEDENITLNDDDSLETIENNSEYSENSLNVNISTNSETESSTRSSSKSSNKKSRSVIDLIKSITAKVNNNKEIETPLNEEKIVKEYIKVSGNRKDVMIILSVNTLCLFVAFVTLRNYNKSLEEEL
jgi:hypothetical protein